MSVKKPSSTQMMQQMQDNMQHMVSSFNELNRAYRLVCQHCEQSGKNLQLVMASMAAQGEQLRTLQDRCNRHLPPDLPPVITVDQTTNFQTTAAVNNLRRSAPITIAPTPPLPVPSLTRTETREVVDDTFLATWLQEFKNNPTCM
jgi:hypothetical protein